MKQQEQYSPAHGHRVDYGGGVLHRGPADHPRSRKQGDCGSAALCSRGPEECGKEAPLSISPGLDALCGEQEVRGSPVGKGSQEWLAVGWIV